MFLAEASIQLVPDGTLLLHLVVIFVMVFILNHTLLKPINRILAEREKQIGGRLNPEDHVWTSPASIYGRLTASLQHSCSRTAPDSP